VRNFCRPVADRPLEQERQTRELEVWFALLQLLSEQPQHLRLDFLEVDLVMNVQSWCLVVHVVEQHESVHAREASSCERKSKADPREYGSHHSA